MKASSIKKILFIIVINICLFIFIEGFLSTLIVLKSVSKPACFVAEETAHTKYDKLLGWVNIPNIEIKDMYGPGIYLKTNLQSFRNDKDFNVCQVPQI